VKPDEISKNNSPSFERSIQKEGAMLHGSIISRRSYLPTELRKLDFTVDRYEQISVLVQQIIEDPETLGVSVEVWCKDQQEEQEEN